MKGRLLLGEMVEIDARAPMLGGAWRPIKKEKRNYPVAFDGALLQFFLSRMLEYLEPVIVDIGASTGSFSLLPIFHKKAEIMAFEPNPVAAEVLQANLILNGIANRVEVFPYALSNYTGKGILKVPKKLGISGLACLGKPQRFSKWEEIKVDITTLDSFNFEHIDLMKIDTEGCELFVLQGAERVIRRDKPKILLEFWQPNTEQFGYDANEILRFLKFLGYKKFERLGKKEGNVWATI